MNETKLSWGDLGLFVAVARGGGLAGGARLTGMSAPSLGRHMANLEQAYGEELFIRQARGYDLTAAGQELLQQALEIEAQVHTIERRRDNRRASLPVHISAGTWTTLFLIRNMAALHRPDVRLVLQAAEARHDISRRETTIGIRNARPTEAALVARRTARVTFAPYVATQLAQQADPVGFLASSAPTPSAEWVRQMHAGDIVLQVSHPRSLLDLAMQGAGQAVLPCFIGDAQPGLQRSGGVIDALTHEQWLVVHGEDRTQPQVRQTITAITRLLTSHKDLFAGERTGIADDDNSKNPAAL